MYLDQPDMRLHDLMQDVRDWFFSLQGIAVVLISVAVLVTILLKRRKRKNK
ncbi:MAG: hypothetical protein Q4D12_02020 [Bacteroidales bacterium]|nr:hypothetical protein [Bacteroidales bacterium]